MEITFESLQEKHFSLLLKWLEASHVKKWWDSGITWTSELIKEKYTEYTQGYKIEGGVRRPVSAYIIYVENIPVGYIQLYNAYDFARSEELLGLPESLAAVDIFIGETDYVSRGIGTIGLPTRIGAPPEISVLRLRKA